MRVLRLWVASALAFSGPAAANVLVPSPCTAGQAQEQPPAEITDGMAVLYGVGTAPLAWWTVECYESTLPSWTQPVADPVAGKPRAAPQAAASLLAQLPCAVGQAPVNFSDNATSVFTEGVAAALPLGITPVWAGVLAAPLLPYTTKTLFFVNHLPVVMVAVPTLTESLFVSGATARSTGWRTSWESSSGGTLGVRAAHFGFLNPETTYLLSAWWLGDFRPPANHTAQPRFGGIVPSIVSLPNCTFAAFLRANFPWDSPGQDGAGLPVGTPIKVAPEAGLAATVNGQDVPDTFFQPIGGHTRALHSPATDGTWKRQAAFAAAPQLGAPQPARLASLILALASGAFASSISQRRVAQAFLLRLVVGLCLVWAVSASPPACTRLTVPPNGEVVTVCAPPWPRTPTTAPTAGDPVTIDVTFASSTTGLLLVSAEVNGMDVGASFAAGGGGVYSLTYTTGVGDGDWPWAGLEVGLVLSGSGGGLFAELNSTVVPGTKWGEDSDARGMNSLASSSGEGVCMGDVDGDGDVDVFAAMDSATNQLWINDGSGVFVNEGASWGVAGDASDRAHGCGFGDADGDGWVDLVVTRNTDDVIELYMNGGGTFVEDGVARGVNVGDNSVGMSWGDVDGDGDVDLFVCGFSQRNRLFMNDGAGVFTEDGVDRGVGTLTRNSAQSALVDFDGDGDLDIVVVNNGQANELYVNGGDGNFEEAGVSRGFADAGPGIGVSVGDWSGDGVVDVYVPKLDSRDVLLLNDGGGVFSEVGAGAGVGASTGRSRGVVTFDIENDGDVDVVVGVESGSDYVWVNDGLGGFVDGSADLTLGSSVTTLGVSAGDIDGDGDVDVIMGRTGAVYVSHSAEGGAGRSVVVRPLTAGGAQSASGAAVRVECVDGCEDGWVGVRVIGGGGSYMSQSGYDAVIGVPVPSATYDVSVRWAGDFHPRANWTSHPGLGGIVPSTLTSAEDRLFVVRPYPVTVTVGGALPWDYVGVTTRDAEGAALPTAGTVIEFPIVVSPWGSMADLIVLSGSLSGRPATPTLTMGLLGNGTISFVIGEEDVDWPWGGVECAVTLADSGGLVSSNASSFSIPGTTWSEESDARGMAALATVAGRGVCMGDVDGDGDVDVFATMRSDMSNQLWVNDGSGVFVDEGASWGVTGDASDAAHGCGFGDADGDGWVDLVFTRYTDDVIELYMNGGGTFVEDGEGRGMRVGDGSLGVSWGDVDGDSDVDLFVCSFPSKRNRLFMNDGAGVFTEDGVGRGVGTLTRSSNQAALVDIDGDGDLDVLVANTGANELYVNGGDGNFEEDGVGRGFSDASTTIGLSVGDWSGDGVVDVYVTNYDSRDLLLLNDGSGVFSDVGVGAGVGASTGGSRGVVTFDIENDGDVDVVVGGFSGSDYVWVNDGRGGFVDGSTDLALGSSAIKYGISAGDIDGDGDVDVIMGRSGGVYVSHSAEGGVGRSIAVRPLTAGGAQSAFGAAVRVVCVDGCDDGWVGVRFIDGGGSLYSQSGYDAVVGVPVPFATYNVSVRWAGEFHPRASWTSHPGLGSVVPSTLTSAGERLFVVRPRPVTMTVGGALPWDYVGVTTLAGEAAVPPTAGTVIGFPIVVSPWGSTVDLVVVSGSLSGRPSTPTLTMGLLGNGTISFVIGEEDVDWPWGGVECSATLVDSGGLVSSNASTFSIPGTTWSEESDARGMAALSNSNGRGVCMGDVDGDGDVDVFVAMIPGTANQLWVNDGSGVFLDEGGARGVAGGSSDDAAGCGFGDVDGDGWVDLVVTRYTDDVIELYMNGGGTFVEDGETLGVSAGDDSLGVSWGDVDGDGDVDLFVCGQNSKRNRLFVNDGAGVFTEDGVGRGVGILTRNSEQSALVDIDGDGDLDVLVVNFGANELYVNRGDGYFEEAGVSRGFATDGDGFGVSVGDWSGDGVVDVYVTNYDSRDLLLLNDGSGVFSEVGVGAGIGASTGGSRGVVTFDIENDGDVDVVVGAWGSDHVWVNDGRGGFLDGSADLALGSSAFTLSVVPGDIDGDGDVDIVMGHSGEVYVSHSAQGGAGRSVVVRPLTAGGAQSAFGAAVRVGCVDGCDDWWVGVRVIDGGSSYLSQNGYDAVIGVPVPSATYNVSVRWAGDFHPRANWTSHPGLGGVVPSTLTSMEDRLFIVRPRPVTVTVGGALPWDFVGVTTRDAEGAALPTTGTVIEFPIVVSPWGSTADLVVVSGSLSGRPSTPTLTMGLLGNGTISFVIGEEDVDWPWGGVECAVTLADSGGLVSSNASTFSIPGTTWSEESDARGMAALANSYGYGVCMGDVDGDGDVDVFAAMYSGTANQLWVNDGNGVFVDEGVARGVTGDASDRAHGCGFGDADGDEWVDLVVTRYGDDLIELYMNGGGTFVEDGEARGVSVGDDSLGMSWGDVDGDGDVDLFVCGFHSRNRLFMNDGAGVFTEDGVGRGVGTLTRSSNQAALVDIDGDGDLDILVVNTVANELYVNGGDGNFGEDGVSRGFADADGDGRGVSVGDWSGDGAVDVYVTNSNSRDLLLLNDGSGVFSEVGVGAGIVASTGLSVGVVTFDIENDGDVDVVVGVQDAVDFAWMNDGVGEFVDGSADLALGSFVTTYGVSAGDIDGDGDVDVIMSRSGKVYVSHSAEGGVGRSIVVRPLTAGGAQSAFGAAVRVECVYRCGGGWLGLRVIDGGSSYNSQSGYDAVVGVPVPSATYNVSVRWAGDFHPPSNWTSHPGLGGVVPSTLTSLEDRLLVVRPYPVTVTVGDALPWDHPGVTARTGQETAPPTVGTVIEFPIVVSPWGSTVDLVVVSGSLSGRPFTPTLTLGLLGNGTISFVIGEEDVDWPWGGVECSVTLADSGGLVSSNTSTFSIPGTTWSEESDARGMAALANDNGRGVCMGDVDGDGDVDVFAAMRSGTASQLWVNDGSGVLVDEGDAQGLAGDASDAAHGCGFGDADGDGWVDLVVTRHTDGVIELYMNDGGMFVEEGEARGVSVGDDSLGVSWGDVNGDGDVDLFVCGYAKRNRLFMNDGAGVFTEEGVDRGVGTLTRSSRQSALVDIDGDGDLDVLVVNDGQANELYVNGGEGSFEEVGVSHGFVNAGFGHGVSVGDWSGDGVVDVYVTNGNSGDVLLLNDGSGVFSEVGLGAGATGNSYGVVTFDVENDGDVDVVVGVDGGFDHVWVNDGLGGFVDGSADLALGSSATPRSVSAGDIDGDGDVDVIMGRSGGVYVSHSAEGGVARSIVVRPLTAGGAQSASGAAVRVECVDGWEDGWVGLRFTDGGSRYMSQSGYDAVIGVPVPSATYNVSVRWAGDFHPESNWTSHPGLGGVVPSTLASVEDRLFIVRPFPFHLVVNQPLPWDYASVTVRTVDPSPPAAGDTILLSMKVPPSAVDLSVSVTINGQNAASTFTRTAPDTYTLQYTTTTGQTVWPWAGLHIIMTVVDGIGLISTLADYIVPGTTLEESAASTGLGLMPSTARGLCMGDVDGDGDIDLFVTSTTGHRTFANSGGGFFTETTATSGVQGSDNGAGCAMADVDGDGDLDVLVVPAGSATNQLYVQTVPGVFLEEGGARGLSGTSVTGQSVAFGDIDGDGSVDAYTCASGGANQLYTNDGAGTLSLTTVAASTSPSMAAALVDIDGDADLDIVVVNDGLADELHINSGGGSFLQRASNRGFAHEGPARGLAVGDMTGDGLVDIVVTQAGGRSLVYMNVGGSFEERGVQLGLAGLTDNVDAAMTDIDQDGDLDVVAGSATGAETVWISVGGASFTDHSAGLGVTSANASRLTFGDIDGDGDVDILTAGTTKVYLNHNAQPGAPNWVTVETVTASGSTCAHGALIRLTCVTGCESRPWFGVRFLTSDGGCQPVHFGLPAWGSTFDVSVTFVGGATHDKGTDPALGGVTAGTALTVVDRPYLTDITALFPPTTTLLGINDTVVVTLWAGLGRADLVPAPTCCFINSVQVRDTFVGGGDGTYNLTYVVSEGDAEWEAGTLGLISTLQSSSGNLTMVELEYKLGGVPAGDPMRPSIQFDCRPGTASASVWEPICVSCPGEDSCTLSYTVESTTLMSVAAQVPASNFTSPTAATFFVGPFNDSDIASLVVFAEDGAGNPSTPDTFSWRVDTSSPVTALVEKPDPVTQRTGASFTLQCSEAACSFAYRFNDGALTQVGGNGTSAEDVPVMHTELVVAPARVSNVSSPWVAFYMNASEAGMLVNATVEVSLGSQRWTLGVEGNMTAPLQLPVLSDGTYVLGGVGKSGDGISDVTPVQYVFTVDTERPVATILQAPGDGDGSAQPTIVVGCSDDCTYLWRSGALPLNSSSWQLAEFGVMQPTVESVEEHGFEVRPVDAAGNVGEAVSVTWTPVACPSIVPAVAITSSVDVGGGHRHISFSSVEDGAAFDYRLDGGMWVTAASSTVLLTGLAPGLAHTVEARAAVPSVCNAGLAATRPPPTLSTWSEAGAPPPQVSLLTVPDANTPDVFAEFQLLPTVRQSWLEYSLDGEPWTPCSTTLVVGPLQAGEHTMQVRAMTEGGEPGDTQAHTWTITAASDSSIVLNGLPDGVHTLLVIATDDAGSFEVAPKTFEWRVDTVPPVIAGNMTTPRFSTSRTAVVEVACEGEIDPCVFCWTSATVPSNCSDASPLHLEAPDDGEHVVDVRAVDSVGLVSESGIDVLWTADSAPPRVTIGDVGDAFIAPLYDTGSVDAVVASTSVQLNLTADEVVAGYYVTLNGEQWPPDGMGLMTDSLPVFYGLQSIINAVTVAGVDPSGNIGEPVVLHLLVDVAAPAVTTFTSPLPELTKEAVVVAHVACTDTVGGSGARHIAVMVESEVVGQVAGSSGSLPLPEWTTGLYNVSAACVDVAGNVDLDPTWSVVEVDQVAPTSSFSTPPPGLVASSAFMVWVEANEVSANEARVVNETAWLPANASGAVNFENTSDGVHSVELRATDVAGNVEEAPYVAVVVEVDTTPPDTVAVLVGSELVEYPGHSAASPRAEVTVDVSASEATSGYQVWVGAVPWATLAVPDGATTAIVSDLSEGVNTIDVAAVDVAGNVDPSPVRFSVWVDLTPPDDTSIVSLPVSPTPTSSMSIGVASVDVGVGVDFVVVSVWRVEDGVAWPDVVVNGSSGSASVFGLSTGTYNVSVVGVDVVGNVDSSPAIGTVVVDQDPPVSSFSVDVPPYSASPTVSVWVEANEEAAVYGRVAGLSDWVGGNGSGVVTFDVLPDGPHVIELRAIDVVGNVEPEPYAAAGIVVDTVEPVLFWMEPPVMYTSNPVATGCFAANDSNPVSFSVGSPPVAVIGDDACFTLVVSADGEASVEIFGEDAAGNVGDVLPATWVLDTAPPAVVVTSPVSSSPACVHGNVTACGGASSATTTLGCSDGSPSVTVSPCRPQFAVQLEEATAESGCVQPTTRRLADGIDFLDAPIGEFTIATADGDGRYSVSVRAVDGAGNVEVFPTVFEWFVDTVDPVRPSLIQAPEGVVAVTTASFVVQLVGDNSPGQTVFRYTLDGGVETVVGDLPEDVDDDVVLQLAGLDGGAHSLALWAVDQAGNVGPSVLHNWEVVNTAPATVVLSGPAAVSGDATPGFVFAARWRDRTVGNDSEPDAAIEVSLNGAPEYTVICEDTLATGGICVWNATLTEVGEYTLNVRADLAGIAGDPTTVNWEYKQCSDAQFAVIEGDGGIGCFACPPGGNCAGGLTTQSGIAAVQGFWAPPGSTGESFYECPVEEACLPGGDVVIGNETQRLVSQCGEGYIGTLCAVCDDGYFEQFGLCVSCGTQTGVAWVIMFAVLVAVIAAGVLFFKYREFMPIDQLKVTLSMAQIIASANTAYAIPWPPLFADFLNFMRVFLIEAVSLTRANCAQPMTFYGSLTVTLVAFKLVLLVVVFGPVLLHKWKQRGRQHTLPPARPDTQRRGSQRSRRRSSIMQSMASAVSAAHRVDWAKIFKITFLFLFVAYPGVSLKIMTIFKCVEVEGEFWLVADMRLKCYEGDWYGYALYAFVMGCLYTGGLPFAITVILWRNRRRLQDAGVVAKWGFLYESYGVGAYLWEVVELLRKLWLSALVVLMEEGSPLQVTVAVLICGWAHVLHAVYKPWRGIGDGGTYVYVLQHGSLGVTAFVFLMGLLFKVEGVSQDGETYNFLAWAMLLACVEFIVAAAFVLLAATMTLVRRARLKATVGGGGSGKKDGSQPVVSAWTGDAGGDASRALSNPRAVRASRMSVGRKGSSMAWVGNPLRRGGADDAEDGKATAGGGGKSGEE